MTTLRVLLHVAAQRDYKLHSLDFNTAFLQGSLHEEIWLRRPPGFTGSFPPGTQWSLRRPVYGHRQVPRELHDTLRTMLAALGFAPSTADPSLFLRTDTLLPPFYILVYVNDLVFATADTAGLAHVKSFSASTSRTPRLRPLLSLLATRSLLCLRMSPTSGMGLVLGGRSPVVLTGHADASWVDDLATQRSSQGYTFSLGSSSISWRSTRSSSVLSSSCEAEIYAGAMAAQELRWLIYLLTDLGEPPRSPLVLYVDNKAMLALCWEHRLEHRTKHIALHYFLARELQQRGQLRLAYVASQANTADIFTKALQPCDHQRFCTMLACFVLLCLTGLRGASGGSVRCLYVIRTGDRAGQTCGKFHSQHCCFSRRDDAWRAEFGDEAERPRWAELFRSGVYIFALAFDAILAAMYAFPVSAEGDCYLCVPPNLGKEAAAQGATESALLGTVLVETLHTFTLDSSASSHFFRESTTLTPLSAPVPVKLADPSGGPVLACSSTVLPCPTVPSGSLSGLRLSLFSTNLVSTAALQDAMVTTTTPGGQRVSICMCTRTGRHLATFTRRPESSLYTLATKSPQVAASAEVSASGLVAAPSSCRLLSHQTLLSLPPLPPSPTLPSLLCVEGRRRAAPHFSSFPRMTAPLQTLHMDVWGPARVSGQSCERYFLLVVDNYTRYTRVFPLRSKGEVPGVLVPWIRVVRLHLRERFREDLLVLHLHSHGCGEFSSDLLRDFCRGEGILQWFTLPASLQQNGDAECRIGLVMEPRDSLPETSPTLRWTGKVGNASVFRVWGFRAFVCNTSADKLSARAIPCDVMFDMLVPFYLLFPYHLFPLPPPPFFLAPGPPPVDPLPPQGPAPSGVSQVDPLLGTLPVKVAVDSGAARGAAFGGAASGEPGGAEPGGANSEGAESGGAEPQGTTSAGGPGGASSRLSPRRDPLSTQQLREWFAQRTRLRSGAAGTGGSPAGGTGAGGAGATSHGRARSRGTGAAGAGRVGDSGAGDPGAGGTGAGGAGAGGGGVGDPRGGGVGARGSRDGGSRARGIGASSPGGAEVTAGAKGTRGAGAAGPGSARTKGTGAAGAGGVGGTGAGGARARGARAGDTGAGGTRPGGADARGTGGGGAGAGDPRAGGAGAGGAGGGGTGAGGTVQRRPFFVPCRLLLRPLVLPFLTLTESESNCPPSVGGEYALGTDILEDRQEDFECLAAAITHLVAMLLEPEGDSDAPDILTPRSYAEAITGTYVDAVPPSRANIVDGMWIFRGVDFFQTFSPTPKMTTLRVLLHVTAQRDYELHSLDFNTAFLQGSLHEEIWPCRSSGSTGSTTLAALGFAPSTADPSLFLRTDTSLPPFYVLVYVDDLVFATADTEALALVKSELARRTITLTQSHMVHQVLQRFSFRYFSPQSTPLPTGHSLSAPPSDESYFGHGARAWRTGSSCPQWTRKRFLDDDLAMQRPSKGYTFSLGSGSVSWRSSRSSSVLSSSCEAEIYAGAMAAQELRWLTYLPIDLGERPRSSPFLYIDNKAMIALC
ncbi:unnamed protein product [Closterium sp. NIES-53]